MEKISKSNIVHLCGRVLRGPAYSHKTYGEVFYIVVLGICRKSGYEDRIRLMISDKILGGRSPRDGELLEISGHIRTYNKEVNGKSKLEITILVREMKYLKRENFSYNNEIYMEGFICKDPVRRTSPLGRELCDLMIAVNRLYNKSDYIPSIAWGKNAAFCESLKVGDKVAIVGRIQSRDYRKFTEEGYLITKTAYEVSVKSVDVLVE